MHGFDIVSMRINHESSEIVRVTWTFARRPVVGSTIFQSHLVESFDGVSILRLESYDGDRSIYPAPPCLQQTK